MKRAKRNKLGVVTGILFLLLALAWFLCLRRPSHVEIMVPSKAESMNMASAISQYFIEFGAYPCGGSSVIARALGGDNPKNIVFFSSKHVGKEGEFLDPWQNPYDIRISEDGLVWIRSAGPNGIMGDRDDKVAEEHVGK